MKERFEQAKMLQKQIADKRVNKKLKQTLSVKFKAKEREGLLMEQLGLCAICEVSVSVASKRYHLDHDHDTGEIRGVLCHGCNVGLGCFKDDPRRLLKAVDYLNKFRFEKVEYTLPEIIEPIIEPELIVDPLTEEEFNALPGPKKFEHLRDLEKRRAEAKAAKNWWANLPELVTYRD